MNNVAVGGIGGTNEALVAEFGLLDQMPCALIVTDARHRVTHANSVAASLAELQSQDLTHLSLVEVFSAMRLDVATAWVVQKIAAEGAWQGEVHIRPRDGAVQAFWLHARLIGGHAAQASHTHMFVLFDITHLIQREHRLRWLAETDALTGLANRSVFMARLDEAIEFSRHDHSISPAILFIDLDGFKQVNDQLGHAAGDGLLCDVAKILETSVRAHDMAARIGGDEFVVLLIGATNPVLVDTARRINERLAFELAGAGGRCLSVTCSIGVAVFPHDGLDSKGLLKRADRAMYSAKRKGKNGYCLAREEIITN